MNPTRLSAVVILSLTGFSLHAAPLVSWGPSTDIIPGASNQSMAPGHTGSQSLSLASLANPTVGAAYYPNSTGASPEFYAASYRISSSTGLGNTTFVVAPNATNDRLLGTFNAGAGISAEVNTIYMWTQPLFLSGGSSAPSVTLDGMSVFSGDNGSSTATTVRFVIQLNGSDFYVSDPFAEGASSISDPTAVAWYTYSPTTDFSLIGSVASLSSTDFDQLTAAGVYVRSTGSGTVQGYVNSFQVTGTVPEPGTAALLLGGSLLVMAVRRHRALI